MRDQEIIGLWEAYQQVYAQPQEEVELDEGRTTSLRALSRESAQRKADKERGRPETESEVHGRLMMGNFRPGASQEERAAGGRQRLKDRGKVPQKDGKDMFEHILEYLVAEGYADTNKAALVIMANMSEEWKQSIVEGVRPGEVETPLDKKKYRERRRSLAGSEERDDARSRGHEEPSTGRTYSTDEARSRRRGIHTPAGKPNRDAARDAAGGETGHGGPLRPNKVRKARAMGELGEK